MSHGHKPGKKPKDSAIFIAKEYIETVSATNYARIKAVVNGVDLLKK
jgi:hypothetical protein